MSVSETQIGFDLERSGASVADVEEFTRRVTARAMLRFSLGPAGSWLTESQCNGVLEIVQYQLQARPMSRDLMGVMYAWGVGDYIQNPRFTASNMEDFMRTWTGDYFEDPALEDSLAKMCFWKSTNTWVDEQMKWSVQIGLEDMGVDEWGMWPIPNPLNTSSEHFRGTAFEWAGWLR